MPAKYAYSIFYNLEDIHAANVELLANLERIVGDWNEEQPLGPVFLEMVLKAWSATQSKLFYYTGAQV